MTKYKVDPKILEIARRDGTHSVSEYLELGEWIVNWLDDNPEYKRQQEKFAKRMQKVKLLNIDGKYTSNHQHLIMHRCSFVSEVNFSFR